MEFSNIVPLVGTVLFYVIALAYPGIAIVGASDGGEVRRRGEIGEQTGAEVAFGAIAQQEIPVIIHGHFQ